jgi:hypothetical protein
MLPLALRIVNSTKVSLPRALCSVTAPRPQETRDEIRWCVVDVSYSCCVLLQDDMSAPPQQADGGERDADLSEEPEAFIGQDGADGFEGEVLDDLDGECAAQRGEDAWVQTCALALARND